MIAQDPKSFEIVKPILRGRDIQRYRAQWAGLWLLYCHSKLSEYNYPAIRQHLLPHKERLLRRRGGANPRTGRVPYQWWQLQVDYFNSGAYQEFSKEKLFWMDMSNRGRFAYSDSEMYCNDKGFIMTGESLKFLCAVLNSALITWLMKSTALTTGMGLIQWKKFTVERLPVPRITISEQRPFIDLVDSILSAELDNPSTDALQFQAEIDKLVYAKYELSQQEIVHLESIQRDKSFSRWKL